MCKLIVEEWISLDGYSSDKNGKLDFFTSTVSSSYSDKGGIDFLNSIDCILLGRKTYEQFAALWPGRETENNMLAHKINTVKKIVFSGTLKNAPWGKWEAATIERGVVIEKIQQLKSLSGGNVVLWGSVSLSQSLMKENMIDEYRLHVCPSLLAGGKKFFTEDINPSVLNLVESKQHQNGNVLLNYQRTLI